MSGSRRSTCYLEAILVLARRFSTRQLLKTDSYVLPGGHLGHTLYPGGHLGHTLYPARRLPNM